MKGAFKNKSNLISKNEEIHPAYKTHLTLGQRAADKLTAFCGSWTFILCLIIVMFIWIVLNILVFVFRWDPYPFILLNLFLSCLAAIEAPIILMSQNREVQRDRITTHYDYQVNRKAEREIEDMQKDLHEIKALLKKRK